MRHHREHQAATLVSDAAGGKKSELAKALPAAGKGGAMSAAELAKEGESVGDNQISATGFDYSRTGWAPRFGIPVPDGTDMDTLMTDQSTWLEERLQDKFFGDWYHNAAIIFFCAFT